WVTVQVKMKVMSQRHHSRPRVLVQREKSSEGKEKSTGNVSYTISVYNKSIALKGAPHGTYWLCGRFAYYSLPPNWGGTCTVGFVVPAMRVLGNTETELRVLFWD
ncbi:unnamed protein product, partial [Coregonus sp. 'balchen']